MTVAANDCAVDAGARWAALRISNLLGFSCMIVSRGDISYQKLNKKNGRRTGGSTLLMSEENSQNYWGLQEGDYLYNHDDYKSIPDRHSLPESHPENTSKIITQEPL